MLGSPDFVILANQVVERDLIKASRIYLPKISAELESNTT